MLFIGLDIGSVSAKYVIVDEQGKKIKSYYERHKGHPLPVALKLLREINSSLNTENSKKDFSLSITGSAGRLLASILKIVPVNEIVAQAFATSLVYPSIRTIIEMGGEDSKLILLEPHGKTVTDFSMNSVCAAGTGSFLDQQAERLKLTIEEFSELALKSKKPSRIAGRCSVFAKSDMIHLQQIATPVEDIVAGLCFAVARNFKGSILRGRKLLLPVSFQGGVAANKGMVRAFKEIFNLDELIVPEDFALMGAYGAVMKDIKDKKINYFDLSMLETYLNSYKPLSGCHQPLKKPGETLEFGERRFHSESPYSDIVSIIIRYPPEQRKKAFMGIDVGSISTNLAVINEKGELVAKRYLMTAGRPIEAVRQGLMQIEREVAGTFNICGVGTTGSGRYMIADFVGADIVKNEITAQATAAVYIDSSVDTIFEIGGQDSKYISLQNGIIVDFEMNKACAAGTGSFLEEQAEKLSVSIKNEFQERALSAKNPCRLGERCTVFMENSLIANLQKGADKNDLLAGLAYSIVQNYINRVVAGKKIGRNIFFQGGVAFNKSVAAAFEKYLGKKITIPPHHDVTGAIGMALIAKKYMRENPFKYSAFKGFDLSKKPYEISSFQCKGCPNVCEINRVKISGEQNFLFYGGRCEKYDIRKKDKPIQTDLFLFREEMLWKEHLKRKEASESDSNKNKITSFFKGKRKIHKKIGIPYIFYFHDFLPFWSTLLWELGFDVIVSQKTNRQIINLGLEKVLAESCFPVKVAHGHIQYLIDQKVDAILIPSFINLNSPDDPMEKGVGCPYSQAIPYISNIAFENIKIISPIINLRLGKKYLINQIYTSFRPFGISRFNISRAIKKGEIAQKEFIDSIQEKGKEILSNIENPSIVIVGRAYNSLDSGVNLQLHKKLADLDVLSIPFDFLPLENYQIHDKWPNMYWRSGQRILKAARFIKETKNLYPIFIGNFLCGPDSFILKYFKEEMGDKPFLHIEIDEHSADTGAITRCEAFLDSVANRDLIMHTKPQAKEGIPIVNIIDRKPSWKIYIPRMSDHAFALAAAFERCGINAEVLPESDKQTIDIGKKFVSGKECYPCAVTTGDMVKKVLSTDFQAENSAFFMPSGSGPCRFGQYNIFHRLVLDNLGYKNVPIYAPNQDTTFYSDLGIVGKDFTKYAWEGIIAIELLNKCLHETRPFEAESGISDNLYTKHFERLYNSLRQNNGDIKSLLMEIKTDFMNVPRKNLQKPLIGIIGEIFVRSHRFSNEDLVRKVESLGGVVWLAPVEEWIYYVNYISLRKALLKKQKSVIINFLLKKYFQQKIEHEFSKYFRDFLKTGNEPETKDILKKAKPYLDSSFEGEAILSIGKTIDLIEKGASGIINAMPFGCMPGTIVTALLRGVSRDYGIPFISIPFDGTESVTTEIQIEAFMEQAKDLHRKKYN